MNDFSFNTAVARLMEFVSAIYKYDGLPNRINAVLLKAIDTLILLLAPCAPHFSEELWEMRGNKESVFLSAYPVCDEKALTRDEIELAVQLNSKVNVPADTSDEEIKEIAFADETFARILGDKQVVKCIVVKGRLINFIVK